MSDIDKLVQDVLPGILFVQGENEAKYPNSNSLIIKTSSADNSAALIDCGLGSRTTRKLRKEFKIAKVILSHWHEDHTHNHLLLRGAMFLSHPADISPLRDMSTFYRNYGLDGSGIEKQFTIFMESLGIEPFGDVMSLGPGEHALELGDYCFDVIHAPGHTAGHICLYEHQHHLAFLGDIDLSSFGPWYGTLDANIFDFEASIKKIMALDIDIAITSHEGAITGKSTVRDRLEKYLKRIDDRNERLLALMDTKIPRTPADLAGKNIVYRRYDSFKEYLLIAERIMIENHLRYLMKSGKVVQQAAGFVLI
nr:MBL fold metallo-hydrolase [Candidatus Sigynarchaeota archaeon]